MTGARYSERIVWGPTYPLSAALAIAGAVQLTDRWAVGVTLVGCAAVALWFCRARYTVDSGGVEVVIGGGRPRLHLAAGDITSVEPSRIPLVTGWGYRGSWRLFRRVAVSLGGAGAVLVTTSNGKRLQLSSRSPGQLLAAIATLVEDRDVPPGRTTTARPKS